MKEIKEGSKKLTQFETYNKSSEKLKEDLKISSERDFSIAITKISKEIYKEYGSQFLQMDSYFTLTTTEFIENNNQARFDIIIKGNNGQERLANVCLFIHPREKTYTFEIEHLYSSDCHNLEEIEAGIRKIFTYPGTIEKIKKVCDGIKL